MHSLVRRYIKTAIGFLIAGLALGAALIVQRELGRGPVDPALVSAHTHVLLIGFVMFMILGVAQWIFPRPAAGDRRYRSAVAAAVYWILLVATAGRFGAEVLRAWSDARWLRWAVVAGGLCQVVGFVLYFWVMWSRVRPAGSRMREAQGERF